MRRFWCAKYAAALLASTALTFHLLYNGGGHADDEGDFSPSDHKKLDGNDPRRFLFTKSTRYLRRKLTEGNLSNAAPPRWTVIQGNITVHEGRDSVPFDVSFDMTADNVCRDFDASKKKILIFVASSASHVSQRRAIRQTWGLKQLQRALNYRVVFVIGRSESEDDRSDVAGSDIGRSGPDVTRSEYDIEQEKYRYGDLVRVNLTETFRNLGRKSVSGLHWSKEYCPQADFVMKTDDDILVHIPNLLSALEGSQSSDPLLLCHENRMRKILRRELLDKADVPSSYHKYEVSSDELPGMFYPPYCSGMAYAFSRDVRERLLEASLTTPVFFIEDVYLTGFCRHKAGVQMTPSAGITLRPVIQVNQAACSFRDGRITSQEVKADELRHLWEELNTQGFFCPELLGYAKRQNNKVSSL